jgi:DNA-directed RNA polymerase specialized sigma24 family protein
LIVRSAFHGPTVREIAQREGIALGTATTRTRRGPVRLRQVLEVTDE